YGGWWETVVTEVSEERMGDSGGAGRDKDGRGNAMWPESVVVGQMDRSGEKVKTKAGSAAAASSGQGGDGDDDEPDFVYTRKTRSLLSRLRTWDKHREAEWEATALEADDEAAAAAAAEPKVTSSPKQVAKKGLPPQSPPTPPPPPPSRISARNKAKKKAAVQNV
ncbi:unnamed protein product, partial [Ectocarpus sp. 8 AP-2014]